MGSKIDGVLTPRSADASGRQEEPLNSRHTPGPWRLDIVPDMGPDGEPYFYINALPGSRDGMPMPDASCVVDPETGILTEEDARLIAAAPDLLSELRRMVGHLSTWAADHADEATTETVAALHCARAAITKATALSRGEN